MPAARALYLPLETRYRQISSASSHAHGRLTPPRGLAHPCPGQNASCLSRFNFPRLVLCIQEIANGQKRLLGLVLERSLPPLRPNVAATVSSSLLEPLSLNSNEFL